MWLHTSTIPAYHFWPQGNKDFWILAVSLPSQSSISCTVLLMAGQAFSRCKLCDFGKAICTLTSQGSASVFLDRLYGPRFGATASRKRMDRVGQYITGGCSDLLGRDTEWHKKKILWDHKRCMRTLLNRNNGRNTPHSTSVTRLFLPLCSLNAAVSYVKY